MIYCLRYQSLFCFSNTQGDAFRGRYCDISFSVCRIAVAFLVFHHNASLFIIKRYGTTAAGSQAFVLFELPPPVPDFHGISCQVQTDGSGHHLNATMTWSPLSVWIQILFVATLSFVPASGVSTRIHEVCIGPVCQFILTWRGLTFRVLVADNHGLLCMSDRQRYIRAWKGGNRRTEVHWRILVTVTHTGYVGYFRNDIGADAIFTWIPIPVWIAVWTSMIPPTVRMRQSLSPVMKLDAALSLCRLRWK